MDSTLAGIKMLFNPVDENPRRPICGHCDSFSNVIDSSDLQLKKHSSLMTSTLAGIKMLFNPLRENAFVPICCNFDPFSNLIDSSNLHSEKQKSLMTSTLAGMKMLFSPLRENAFASIWRIFELFSNTANFIDLQLAMNDLLMISNENGIHRQSQLSRNAAGHDDRSITPSFTVILRRQAIDVGRPTPGNGESSSLIMSDRLTIRLKID
jgi:hypothetical protein